MPHLTNGTFRAKCIEHTFEMKNDKERLALVFTLLSGPDEGQTVWTYKYFTGGAMKYSIADLQTLGWTGSDLSELGGLTNECELVLEDEEWEGKSHTRVKWINAVGGGSANAGQAMSQGQVLDFAARCKARIESLQKPAQPPQGFTTRQTTPADDDVPF